MHKEKKIKSVSLSHEMKQLKRQERKQLLLLPSRCHRLAVTLVEVGLGHGVGRHAGVLDRGTQIQEVLIAGGHAMVAHLDLVVMRGIGVLILVVVLLLLLLLVVVMVHGVALVVMVLVVRFELDGVVLGGLQLDTLVLLCVDVQHGVLEVCEVHRVSKAHGHGGSHGCQGGYWREWGQRRDRRHGRALVVRGVDG